MTTIRLVVVRHGESEWNATGRWQGHGGSGLSPRGRDEAEATAARLARELDDVVVLARSDLQRVEETAAPIEASLGVPTMVDPRLRELDVGWWSGLTREEIAAREPSSGVSGFRDGGDWSAQQDATPIGGAESIRDLRERVRLALDELVEAGTRAGGGTIVVVTHGWPVRLAAAMAAGLAPGCERRLPRPANCGITLIDRVGDDAVLVDYNRTDHLSGAPAAR